MCVAVVVIVCPRYANRARNIKNKPTKNIDPMTAQLQLLRRQIQVCGTSAAVFCTDTASDTAVFDWVVQCVDVFGRAMSPTQALQLELVHEHFGGGGGPIETQHPLSSLKDEAVKEYLRTIMQKYGDVGPAFLPVGPGLPDLDTTTPTGSFSPAATPASFTPGSSTKVRSVVATGSHWQPRGRGGKGMVVREGAASPGVLTHRILSLRLAPWWGHEALPGGAGRVNARRIRQHVVCCVCLSERVLPRALKHVIETGCFLVVLCAPY